MSSSQGPIARAPKSSCTLHQHPGTPHVAENCGQLTKMRIAQVSMNDTLAGRIENQDIIYCVKFEV